jgi:hypothetical protein
VTKHHFEVGPTTGITAGLLALADDPDIKPCHFGEVMSIGKLLSPNIYFQIEMENYGNIIGQNMQQINLDQLHRKQCCLTVSICLKTLEK